MPADHPPMVKRKRMSTAGRQACIVFGARPYITIKAVYMCWDCALSIAPAAPVKQDGRRHLCPKFQLQMMME